jgi:hypothetical protein
MNLTTIPGLDKSIKLIDLLIISYMTINHNGHLLQCMESLFRDRIEANHTHHKTDNHVILKRDPEEQEELFCLLCGKGLIECQYCEALHLK